MAAHRFGPLGPSDLRDLVERHPLAWLVASGTGTPRATLLPLLLHGTEDGQPLAFEGHLPRVHPLVADLTAAPEALLLFLGPNGYVSPSWMADRTQAPTWNYASAVCRVAVRFLDRPDALAAHLAALVTCHERGRPHAWSIAEMGARFETLAARIVCFQARPIEIHERYKLGQDERDGVYADILAGLAQGAPSALLDWMHRFNPSRRPVASARDPADPAGPRPSC